MQISIEVLFSITVALIGVYATVSKILKDNKKDNEERQRQVANDREKQAERHIEIKKSLDYIAIDVDKINNTIKDIDNKVDAIDRRVTINEQAVKSAHHRLDNIEETCRVRSDSNWT